MMSTLYTFGYLSTKAERIITELIAVGTPIVDIRYNPVSKRWQYTKEMLSKREGIIYTHIPELGNTLYKRALSGNFTEPDIILSNPEKGLARLARELEQYDRVAIMCACSSANHCHRSRVARLASERIPGLEIIHL